MPYGVVAATLLLHKSMLKTPRADWRAYAEDTSGKEVMMVILVIILVPLIALAIWAAVFDLKRRRRRAPLTSHDIGSAARRARANADTRGGGPGVDL